MNRFMTGVASIGLIAGVPSAESFRAQEDTNPCDDPIIGAILDGVAIATGYESCEDMYDLEDPIPVDTPETPQPLAGRYMALGDSVAGGLGLEPVEVPIGDDKICGRSQQAYPELVSSELGLSLTNLACSGATIGDLYTEQHLRGTTQDIEPQLDYAFADGTPELISITAGANDVYWTYFARRCYRTECGDLFDTWTARSLLKAMEIKLELALDSIDLRSDYSPPQVLVTGYYNPLSKDCSNLDPKVTSREIGWFTRQWRRLNRKIEEVTEEYDFAEYVPVDFSGHDACSANPWVQRIGDKAPFHPTAEGQEQIAQSIIEAYAQVNT